MPALKKLIAPGSGFPPARILLDSQEATGKTTPVDVKQVKDKNGNILWGRYEITTASNIKEFEENYCDYFKLTFVNPSYGNKEGEYITAAYNIFSYRYFPVGYSVIGYHGEQLSCEYELKYPYYRRIFSNSGSHSYVTDFESGRSGRDVSDPYSSAITGDTTLSIQNNLGLPIVANKKYGYLNYTPTTSKTTANGGTMTTQVFKNGSQVSSGSYVYYGDDLTLKVTHQYPIAGKLPQSGVSYPLKLDGLTTNLNGSVNTTNTHIYLKTPYSSISLPTYFTRYDYPLRIDSVSWPSKSVSTTLGTKTGYEFKANLIRHALADPNKDIPIAICCNTPEFSIPGFKVVKATYNSGTTNYEASTTFREVLFASMNANNGALNPFKDDTNRVYLEDSTSVTRSASVSQILGNSTTITQLAKPSLCNIYYIYNEKFYRINCLANTVAASQVVIEPIITTDYYPRAEYNTDADDYIYLHGPIITISMLTGACFKGTIDLQWEWEINDSEGSYLGLANGSSNNISFSNLARGVSIDIETLTQNLGASLNRDCSASLYIGYVIHIGDESYYGDLAFEDIQLEETYDG